MLQRMLPEQNRALYWRHMRIWLFGALLSFPSAAATVFLLRAQEEGIISVAAICVLFLPLPAFGYYGLSRKYVAGGWPGTIYRGQAAKFASTGYIALYFLVILLAALWQGVL